MVALQRGQFSLRGGSGARQSGQASGAAQPTQTIAPGATVAPQ
jgi:hypothetical protein